MQLQLQNQQQFNLPAVNQSRSERSLENSSGYGNGAQTFNQTQRLHPGGALTSRADCASGNQPQYVSQLQFLQNQQMMIPSNYSNNNQQQQEQQTSTHLKQNEKIKSYSRKLAKLVSSTGLPQQTHSASTSRTPNAKKKIKTTAIGLVTQQSMQGTLLKTGSLTRSGGGHNTSRSGATMNPSMLATTAIYGNANNNGQHLLSSARSSTNTYGGPQQQNTQRNKNNTNTTFDMEEHIKNVMRSVERKNRQQSNSGNNVTSSYLQSNISQIAGIGGSMINNNNHNGSKTARNNNTQHLNMISQLNEYSPEQHHLSKSPSNNQLQNTQGALNAATLFNQAQSTAPTNKNTIFSNFSNNTYYIGQKKNQNLVGNSVLQQSHSLGKKGSYQGAIQNNTIMLKANSSNNPNNVSGSLSRKRGSTRVQTVLEKNTSSSQRAGGRLQESVELFSGSQTQRNYYQNQQQEDHSSNPAAAISIRKKRASIGVNNATGGIIPSNTAYSAHKSKLINSGAKTSRVNTSNSQYPMTHNQNQHQNNPRQQLQSYLQQMSVGGGINNSTSSGAIKKQQNWFSPPPNASTQSAAHINMSNSIQNYQMQQMMGGVLTSIDNNSSAAMNEKTARTSQFVSPRSFLNKSGGGAGLQNLILSAQQVNNRMSIGEKINPGLIASQYEPDENYNHQQINSVDWQKVQKLSQFKFLTTLTLKKFFNIWKNSQTKFLYHKKRLALYDNLLQAKSQSFREHHKQIFGNLNIIKNLTFLPESNDSLLQNSNQDPKQMLKQQPNQNNKTTQFNEALNAIKISVEKLHTYIVKSNQEQASQQRSTGNLGNRRTSGSSFVNQNDKKSLGQNSAMMNARCFNFDRLLNLTLTALSSSIAQMLIKNRGLTPNHTKIRLSVKFQTYNNSQSLNVNDDNKNYTTHSDYYLTTNPSFKSLTHQINQAFEESEQLIFNNRKLIECLNKFTQLFFNIKSNKNTTSTTITINHEQIYQWDVNGFYQKIDSILKANNNEQKLQMGKQQLLEEVNRDIEEAEIVMRRMEDLKQIIQFEERWQNLLQSNQQQDSVLTSTSGTSLNFVADLDSNLETQTLMERFHLMIAQIPHSAPLRLRFLCLDFKPLYLQLHKIPLKVSQHIQLKVASSLETNTAALRQDLSKAYEIMQQNNPSGALNIYVEQANTVRFIKETMGEFNSRHDSIKKLAMLCKTDNRIIVKDSVQHTVKELEKYIENLPSMIRQCSERLEMSRGIMENKMKESCMSLSKKIQDFEAKYIKHYVQDGNKLNDPLSTLNEIKSRQKMMDDINSKVELYQECLTIMNMKDQFKNFKEITCFQDYKQLQLLHQYTLKLWTILDDWRTQRTSLLSRPFLKLNFGEIVTFLDDSLSFFEQKQSEDPLFKSKLATLSSMITKEMSELQVILYLVRDLKKECIKKKHWNMIFQELGMNQMIGKEEFTLQELQLKYKIYSYQSEIRDIVKLAEQEQDYIDQLSFIKTQIEDKLKFKLVEYKSSGSSQDGIIYLISEFDIVQSQLEEFQVILKKGQNSQQLTEIDIKDQFIELYQQIENMINVLEKINDTQKMILGLDAIFSQNQIHRNLPNDGKKYLEIKNSFNINVTTKIQQNPTLQHYQLHLLSMQESLDKIASKGTLIQKSIEDYLEAKRLAFPRFFFMTDKQFLEFIELAEQNLDFNSHINLLFPGVSKMFLDQPLTQESFKEQFKVPPPMVNDLSQVKSEFIDASSNLQGNPYLQQRNNNTNRMPNQKETKPMKNQNQAKLGQGVLELNNSDFIDTEAFNTKGSKISNNKTQAKPTQVMGMISQLNELFLFEKKVPYQQNKVECWLQGAETNMQDTIGKLINYAVNTFPKQSLDEWILDYPQQVILTTIHLILTHEINELFEEMRKDKENGNEGGDNNRRNSEHGGDSDDDYTGANGLGNGTTPRTPNTRDLIKNSQISMRTGASQHVSQKSSIRFMKKKTGSNAQDILLQPPRKVSTHEFNSNNRMAMNNPNQTNSNYSSSNQRNSNQLQFKQQLHQQNSQYYSDDGADLGFHHQDRNEDDFTESELEALDISRERKKFASNMFGSDFDLNVIAADNKDDTMRILQEKSFRGLYLRLQFWINQICKSLYMSKGCNQDWKSAFDKDQTNPNAPQAPNLNLSLHPAQRLVMQTIINFLSYMRDVVFELKSKKIDNIEDFEWQKQMRLTWNGKDSGCKVDCGAWTTQQANEYFGAKQRIPLTPLTNKYFVFISAAFREKSAVLFRSVPSHDYCGDIFSEFSSICSVPFKEYHCNPKLSMKSLMQFLNGAALASVWIFFEHVDKLDYVHLQTFNKEIQMVQQQFIIAELSQDSSVITAHITVGNQSISQCQRSIERIREQASLESKQQTQQQKQSSKHSPQLNKGLRIKGGNDIKIEDNVRQYNNHDDFRDDDEDEDEDESQYDNNHHQQKQLLLNKDKLNRQSNRQELQYNNEKNQQHQKQTILQNLSQLDLEDEFNNNHGLVQLVEDQEEEDELKLDENLNNSMGGKNNPYNLQNKVCFGVFASISHSFNLKHDKWAVEVSTALQSAFRVLSLTKPEMPIITTMLLKSEGFKTYKSLGTKVTDSIQKVSDFLALNERDDSFSITVRDLKRLCKCACTLLEQQIIKVSNEESKNNDIGKNSNQYNSKGLKKREPKINSDQLMTYNMEKKSKQMIIKEIEEEDQREEIQKRVRSHIEERVISYVMGLFLYEKLYSYAQKLNITETKLSNILKEILIDIFGKQVYNDSQSNFNAQSQSTISTQETLIVSAAKKHGLSQLSQNSLSKLKLIHTTLTNYKPLCLLGPHLSGKTSSLKLVLREVLGAKESSIIVVNPAVMGTYREMYGVYDPISTTQQVIEHQLGPVKNSLFSIIRNTVDQQSNDTDTINTLNNNKYLIVEGDFDPYFTETLLPIMEQQAFKEEDQDNNINASKIKHGKEFKVILPNGIQESLKCSGNVQIIYEMRSLDKVSPRFVSSVQVVNMKDKVDQKEFVQKIKAKAIKLLFTKFPQLNSKLLSDQVSNSLNQILVPCLHSLTMSPHLSHNNGLDSTLLLLWCSRTLTCLLRQVKHLSPPTLELTLTKLMLYTVVLTIGSALSYENGGRMALEDIFSQVRMQLGMSKNQSLFNYTFDFETNELVDIQKQIQQLNNVGLYGSANSSSFLMDSEFIINVELIRAAQYAKLLLKNQKEFQLTGAYGSQKSTIVKYLVKNNSQSNELANYVTKVPMTCLLSQNSIRKVLTQFNQVRKSDNKGCLLIIEDINIHSQTSNFNLIDYIRLVKSNNCKLFNPDFPELQPLNQSVNCLMTSSSSQLLNGVKSNSYFCDTQSPDYEDFLKIFIHKKLQIQPSYHQQLTNIIYGQYIWMKTNSKQNNHNVSSILDLTNLHIIASMINRINNCPYKEVNLIEAFLLHFSRSVTDRIIYPDVKSQVYDNLIKLIKEELPSMTMDKTLTSQYIDNLCMIQQNGSQKITTKIEEAQEFLSVEEFPKPVIKQLCNIYQTLKRPNQHYLYVAQAGSKLSQGIQNIATKLKFTVVEPIASKYRDSHTFIDNINSILISSLRQQKKYIVLISDTYLNDFSYIDYMTNLILAIREASQNCSISLFNSFDTIINKHLRQSLIEASRDIHNQQISHSPHSGISSPASPSSLTTSITESQLLMNALTKVSQNLHFIVRINGLQNYHSYVNSFPLIESVFQVSFVPESLSYSTQDGQEDMYHDLRKWVHTFSVSQVFDNPAYDQLTKQNDHSFNNEFNAFFIPQPQSSQNLFNQVCLFDNFNQQKINSDLNLTIPPEYTQSDQRFSMFKQLHLTIKQFLYKSLASQKQIYQRYYEHYEQLQSDYMKKILGNNNKDQQQQPQVTKNHLLIFNLLSIQEKIDLIQNQLKLKEQQLKGRQQEREDFFGALEKLKEDSQIQKAQADTRIIQSLNRLKTMASAQDFKNLSQAMASNQIPDIDMEIIQALQGILSIKKTPLNHNQGFLTQSPQELVNRLLTLNSQTFILHDQIITKYSKAVQKRIQSQDQDKSVVGIIAKIINEFFKKTQMLMKLKAYDTKILQLKDQLSFTLSLLQLYTNQMVDMREEVEDLLIKEKNMKAELRDLMRRLDMKELKALRNDHKLKSLLKQGKKSENKLDKVKIRMKNLEGDSLILACSVVYLGALSLNERIECRKQLAERLLQTRNIEVSEYWQNSVSEQIHSKYFKKVIQNDMGLKSQMFNKLSHLFVDSLFSEFLFTYIFSPSLPVIYDSVGIYQQELSEEILDELNKFKVKVLFSSDYMIQEKLSNALDQVMPQKKNQLIFINDLSDYSKIIQGKSQDQALLHKLNQAQFNHRVPGLLKENPTLNLPLITLFSANQHFNLNQSYLANATVFNATYVNKNEAWIEIKQILLKHFLPDNYQKLSMIKQQTQILRPKLLERQKAFDQLFMKISRQSVEDKDHKALEEVRQCYIDIKQLDEDYQQYNQAFHNLINEHPLLASYSNIFVILYYALKELSKFTEEITYSWKIYTKVIDMIIAKIIRDLTMNLKNKENEESEPEDGDPQIADGQQNSNVEIPERKKKPKKDKEFTIDEEFFHSVIMPSIYSTIVAGIKQEHVSLFNLIFSMEIALKKTTVNQEDKDFFIQKFFKIKNCYDWRLNPHKPSTIVSGFVEGHQRIKLNEYMTVKRDVLKIYPDLRKLFETIEIKIGKEFTYKEANALLYQKLFKNNNEGSNWKDLPLIKKINVGFICPDDEWRSKLCQFVYEELTTIFDFTEDLNKLHNFIKTASWSLPVALFTSNSINIVNTVCSIASYYGVGLEVLRTDYQQSIKKQERYYLNKEVNDNLKSSQTDIDTEKPLSNEAACIHYDQLDSSKDDRIVMQKHNYQKMFSKDELEIDDKQITQNQSSIQLIEKCAENGTWVLISTLKFPSFWYKISRKLEKMAKKGKVLNTFRLFFDLQGYSLQEIPESFLFNHSVKFYLTEKNNEDMEGFNDVWANILNDDLLNAKDLHNVPVLEPPSDLVKINLNLESNIYESSMDSLIPPSQHHTQSHYKDQINPGNKKKTVKEDKITYSMSSQQYQSKDTIILPQIFTQEHLKDILLGGKDLTSPQNLMKPQNINAKGSKFKNKLPYNNIEDDISEISMGTNHHRGFSSGLMSLNGGGQSILLMEDMSKMEGAFLSELNQAFARKMTSNIGQQEEAKQADDHAKQQQRYEMVKKPAPNHKRTQPPQKH